MGTCAHRLARPRRTGRRDDGRGLPGTPLFRARRGGVRRVRPRRPGRRRLLRPGQRDLAAARGPVRRRSPGCARCCCRRCTRSRWPASTSTASGATTRATGSPPPSAYVLTITYGDRAAARAAAARVRKIHERVTGHRPGDRAAVRGRRPGAAHLGARRARRLGPGRRRAVRRAADAGASRISTWPR